MEPKINTHYIDTPVSLNKTVETLLSYSTLVVDTEFKRKDTYFPKLCLVQIATQTDTYLIDAIEITDVTPLKDILCNLKILKVFHSGKQDLEILYNHLHQVPFPIFDTQIASMVCGYGDSVGFDNIVKELLSKNIDKSMQTTDWTIRPLSEKHIRYAVQDVTILYELYIKLKKTLETKHRSDWVTEEFEKLVDERHYTINPESVWKRLKLRSGSQPYLKMLVSLAKWREEVAIEKNLPRTWVMKEDTLHQIALAPPKNIAKLQRLMGSPQWPQVKLNLEEVLKLVHSTQKKLPKMVEVEAQKKLVPSQKSADAIELLKIFRGMKAKKLRIPAKFLASNNDIIKIVEGLPLQLTPWRKKEFQEEATQLLDGELNLGLQKGRYTLVAKT